MSSVRRITSGSTIQIRTGTISGIGPTGPTGPAGPPGPMGPDGRQGEQGEVGFVDDACTIASAGSPQAVAGDSQVLVMFSSVELDDLATVTSATSFLPREGNYYVGVYIRLEHTGEPPQGYRQVELLAGGITIAATSSWMNPNELFADFNVATGVRTTGSQSIQVRVTNGDSESIVISSARIWISPHGPGMPGPVGPRGPIGPVGPRGVAGPTGPAGGDVEGITFRELRAAGA